MNMSMALGMFDGLWKKGSSGVWYLMMGLMLMKVAAGSHAGEESVSINRPVVKDLKDVAGWVRFSSGESFIHIFA